ncbi:MAG: hypothetical protein HZA05_06975 [Nitrospirae bacterium]|nr:hypothetical protein [Nitrospirota bacterium]
MFCLARGKKDIGTLSGGRLRLWSEAEAAIGIANKEKKAAELKNESHVFLDNPACLLLK